MRQKPITARAVRAVQTNLLFHPTTRSSAVWNHAPDVAKERVVEALAQVLLQASGGGVEPEEAGDD